MKVQRISNVAVANRTNANNKQKTQNFGLDLSKSFVTDVVDPARKIAVEKGLINTFEAALRKMTDRLVFNRIDISEKPNEFPLVYPKGIAGTTIEDGDVRTVIKVNDNGNALDKFNAINAELNKQQDYNISDYTTI